MVDVASGAGRPSGRSQRSKARVDYTSQIYINVPAKTAAVPAATAEPQHRDPKENNSQSTDREKSQKSALSASHASRAVKVASGSSKRSRGNALREKSNTPATISPLGPGINSKASQKITEISAEGKRRRNGGVRHGVDPATTLENVEQPKLKKRKPTGDAAMHSAPKQKLLPGTSQPDDDDKNDVHTLDAAPVAVPMAETSELRRPGKNTLNQRTVAETPPAHAHAVDHADLQEGMLHALPVPASPVRNTSCTDAARTTINADNPLQQRAIGDPGAAPGGVSGWNDVDAIFPRQSGPKSLKPNVAASNFETLGKLVDTTNQQRLRFAQQEVRALIAEKESQEACIRQLKAELEHQQSRHRQHNEEMSKQLQRVKGNYQTLYDRFQKLRGQNIEETREVLEGIWESVEERSEMADQLLDAWKADAEAHKSKLRDSELYAAQQELKIQQGEVSELKNKLLEEAEASLLQAQEIANLRHLVQGLEAVRPQTADAAVQAQPEVSVSTTQTRGGGKKFSLVSPVLSVQARRRAQALDVTCMARSLVPEGADVYSVDTNVMQAALLQPTEPSLAGGPPSVVAFAANAVAAPSPAVADHIRPSPVPCIPAAAVVADAPAVPAARFSSSVRPQHVQVMDTVEAYAHSNSERGSNAAVPRRLVATPQQRALILRDAEQPVCSDPGPVRQRNNHGGPHCMRVPAPRQELQGTPGLSASPAIPSNVAEVGDTQQPSLENLQDGGPMSTSESDQHYGDASDDCGAAEGHFPTVADCNASDGAGPKFAAGASALVAEEHEARRLAGGFAIPPPVMGSTPGRPHSNLRLQGYGDLDSGRSTDVRAQMRMFRDKMLSMEVIQSPYGSAYQCRDLKSGFTFTIKPCVTEAPPIRVPGHDDAPEVVDELTYAPQMETCPEHVKAKLPKVFQEEFDFRADHLHGLQKRIDRALEVVNGNL